MGAADDVRALRHEGPQLLESGLDAAELVAQLETVGAHAAVLVPRPLRATLLAAARSARYEAQPETVGPPERRVRQRLAACRLPPDARPFGGFARALESLLARAIATLPRSPWRAPPRFNDLVLQRYPPGAFALTPHLDGRRFVDLVAIAVLDGSARFCVCADRSGRAAREIPAPPGSVIFLRAPGFQGNADGRPFHCVRDVETERCTLGLRRNPGDRAAGMRRGGPPPARRSDI